MKYCNLNPNVTMALNWWMLGFIAFCVVLLLGYLIWKNLRDEKELIQSFNEELKPEKHEEEDELI